MTKGRYNYNIRINELDYTQKMGLVSYCRHILRAADDDADQRDFGMLALNRDNCTWVLSAISIEFDRFPSNGERTDITTWVNEIGKVRTTRNMVVLDEKGVKIASAVTIWVMIDISSRRPVDITEHAGFMSAIIYKESPIEKPKRLASVESIAEHNHKVAYSDIDLNCHTNALRYLEWMLNLLPYETFENRAISRLDLSFIRESYHGDDLTIKMDDRNDFAFEVVKDGTIPICRANIKSSPL